MKINGWSFNLIFMILCRVKWYLCFYVELKDIYWILQSFIAGFDPDIPGYPRYSMIVDDRRGVYNLRLKGVQLDDEGEYQCQVEN